MAHFGVDTNVLARLVLADDAQQHSQVLARLQQLTQEGSALTVSLSVMLELEWVLRSAAKLPKAQVIKVFKVLLDTQDLLFQDEAVLEQAIYLYQDAAADFAECLFLAQYTRSCSTPMLSFDKRAQRLPSVVAP